MTTPSTREWPVGAVTTHTWMRLAILLLLVPMGAWADEGLHFSVSGGAGIAYAVLGVQVQARVEHFAVFVGSGPFAFIAPTDGVSGACYGGVAGARWYLGSGDGFFVSGQYMRMNYQTGNYERDEFTGTYSWHYFNAATLDLGWRTRWTHFFFDVGAGGGATWEAGGSKGPTPDLTVAAGWEF